MKPGCASFSTIGQETARVAAWLKLGYKEQPELLQSETAMSRCMSEC